jgi:hypothetical protein
MDFLSSLVLTLVEDSPTAPEHTPEGEDECGDPSFHGFNSEDSQPLSA